MLRVLTVATLVVAACSPPDRSGANDGAVDTTSVDAPTGDAPDAPAGSFGDPFGALKMMPGLCSNDGWCWRQPTPHGNDYDHVFSTGPANIWLTAWGFVLQWDGHTWTGHHPPTPPGAFGSQFSMSIGGSGPSNTWLIYGTSLQHWDGATWTIVETLPGSGNPNYNNVWVAPDTGDAFVTVSNGTLERWHGGGVQNFYPCGCFLGAVWGTSSTDIYLTSIGANFHFDGTTFTTIYAGSQILGGWLGVHGDVWVSGGQGGMGHWDGATFTNVPLPPAIATRWIQPIAYVKDDDIWWYVLFGNGGFLHWDGAAMTFTEADASASGGNTPSFNSGAIIGGKWWLVGRDGIVSTVTDPYTLTPVIAPAWESLSSMWGAADDDMYFVAEGTLRHWNGNTTTTITLDLGGVWSSLGSITGIRANGFDELWVSGTVMLTSNPNAQYAAVLLHYDGTTWTQVQTGTGTQFSLCGAGRLIALASGEALGVGACGYATHFTNGAWQPLTTNTTETLTGLWAPDKNHAWIVGSNRTVLQWDRAAPDVMTSDPVPPAATSTGGNGVWELGAITGVETFPWIASNELTYGTIWERSASGWTEVTAPTTGNVDAGMIAIDPNNLVFSNSGNSSTSRFDGAAWHNEDNASNFPMPVLFAIPNGPTFAGSSSGVVVHP